MRKHGFTLLLLFIALHSFSQNGSEPIRVTDMLKIKSIGGITLSNDGSKAAFVVTSIDPDPENKWEYKYSSQIWMSPTGAASTPRQLTYKENSSQPAWSPDGRQLAFVRAADGKPQIFLLALDGGEAMQLTKYKYGASSPRWSPDGKQILFNASIPLKDLIKDSILNPTHSVPKWPFEKPGFGNNDQLRAPVAKADPDGSIDEVRAYLDNNAADKKAKVVDKLNFQDETDVATDMSFSHYFIVSAQPGATPTAVTHGFYRFGNADFTPDGKQLILSGDMDSTEHPDRSLESEIFIVNTDGSGLRMLLGEKGKNYSSPRLSPSGKWLAFQYGGTGFVSVPALAVMPLNGSAADITDIPFDRSKGGYTWSADDKYIYFTAQSNGGAPLYRAEVKTKKTEQLTDFNSGVLSFDIAGGKTVFATTAVTNPCALYTADA
ncbi:MAG: PD40 domain-containing protein, partial [Bacteroidetes bacterium]|nr:PD40 domain-containing protein [Bacteroidota bacterium]